MPSKGGSNCWGEEEKFFPVRGSKSDFKQQQGEPHIALEQEGGGMGRGWSEKKEGRLSLGQEVASCRRASRRRWMEEKGREDRRAKLYLGQQKTSIKFQN